MNPHLNNLLRDMCSLKHTSMSLVSKSVHMSNVMFFNLIIITLMNRKHSWTKYHVIVARLPGSMCDIDVKSINIEVVWYKHGLYNNKCPPINNILTEILFLTYLLRVWLFYKEMLSLCSLAVRHVPSQEWNLILEEHPSVAGIQLQGLGTSHIALLKLNVRPIP